ncbi:CpaE family protein [Candidatus Margulisiibacteriota bacterium]
MRGMHNEIKEPKILSFLSGNGGSGQSTFLVNFASYLSQFKNKKILIYDANGVTGTTAVLLNRFPPHSLQSLLHNNISISNDTLDQYLTHYNSHIYLLPQKLVTDHTDDVSQHSALFYLHEIKRFFDYILIDLPKGPNHTVFSFLEVSNHCYILFNPTIHSIRNTALLNEIIESLLLSHCSFHYVLNAITPTSDVTSGDIEKHLKLPIHASFPYSEDIMHSTNYGTVFLEMKKSKSNKSFLQELSKLITTSLAKERAHETHQ